MELKNKLLFLNKILKKLMVEDYVVYHQAMLWFGIEKRTKPNTYIDGYLD